jgi:predicted amino acid racemase
MYILVRLNPNQGITLGPNFTLTANVGTLVPATATLTQLLAGVSVLADDTVTQVTITSQGVCTNSLILSVVQPTTTSTTTSAIGTTTTTTSTSSTTTTTTVVPCLCKEGEIIDNNAFSYTDCNGVFFSGGGEQGTIICLDINQSYSSNIQNITQTIGCTCL